MPVRATAQSATQKWVQNLGGATDRMTAGANAVTKAPGLSAAAAKQKWLQRTTAAADKFATNVSRVSLESWKNSYITIGIPRVAQGAQAKQDKFTSYMEEFLPYLTRGVQAIDAMPNVTLEDSIARSTAMIRHNAKFKRGSGS